MHSVTYSFILTMYGVFVIVATEQHIVIMNPFLPNCLLVLNLSGSEGSVEMSVSIGESDLGKPMTSS
jgi:hypothetical protein